MHISLTSASKMATVEYDLNLSGGLMEQIHALTAPPMSEEAQKKRVRERGYRRHGRAVNHDCCDSCKEGGDLLCCDRCPAAFHLQCHDPPLSEDELPTGEWMCHKCKVNPQPEAKEDDTSSTCSTHSKHSSTSRKSSQRGCTGYIEEIEWEDLLAEHEAEEEAVGNTSLSMLIKAARLVNPKQMSLPKDLACNVLLPGSSKRRYPFKESGKGSNKKPAHELDNGVVPLPAKLCFICNKSCRTAPLIQCDYCPLLFHMDCLDPPLTSPPLVRWMCPNHAEYAIDQTLLKSTKLTERLQLWDRYAGPINQHAVKVQFLNKIHRKHPPFRIKQKHPRKYTVKVPVAIKAHYAHPASLLPSLSRLEVQAAQQGVSTEQHQATAEEQEEWLSAVVSLQTSIARHLAQKQLTAEVKSEPDAVPGPSTVTNTTKTSKPTASVIPTVKQESTDDLNKSLLNGNLPSSRENQDCSKGSTANSLSNGEMDISENVTVTFPSAQTRTDSTDDSCEIIQTDKIQTGTSLLSKNKTGLSSVAASSNKQTSKVVLGNSAARTVNSSSSILSPKSTTVSTVKLGTVNPSSKIVTLNMSSQGNRSPVSQNKTLTAANVTSSPAIVSLNNALQAVIEGNAEMDLQKLDERLVQILAWQRLQQLLSSSRTSAQPPANSVLPAPANKHLVNNPQSNEVRARALLCPLTGKGQPTPMTYRKLTIGTGGNMDVCLESFGQCSFVSAKHACIFYDEATRHYELLNYSEHGTTVDNVLYSCDFSEKTTTASQQLGVVSSVKKLINKARGRKVEEKPPQVDRETMAAPLNIYRGSCSCKASSSSLIGGSGAGWEGTAILHHGSYIKLGCLQFVFSIVDQAVLGASERRLPATSLLKATLKSPRQSPL